MRKLNFKAIVLGCLADWVGTAAFSLIFGMFAVGVETAHGMSTEQAINFLQQWSQAPSGVLFLMLFGLGFTGLGGYVAARTSQQETLINSVSIGCIAILGGLPFLLNAPAGGVIITTILSIPAATLGGFFYTKKFRL
jgi:hypothetical protein